MKQDYRQRAVLETAKNIATYGFDVYLAESGTYGAYTLYGNVVISFQYCISGEINFMSNLKPSRTDGTGELLSSRAPGHCDLEFLMGLLQRGSSPRSRTLAQYMLDYASSKFTKLEVDNPAKLDQFEVIVGNIGTVMRTPDREAAMADYLEYVKQSRSNYGRAAGEPVCVRRGDEIELEYIPPSDAPAVATEVDSVPRSLWQRCEATWNRMYPDRRKWADLEPSTRTEWLSLFLVYDDEARRHNGVSTPDPELVTAPTAEIKRFTIPRQHTIAFRRDGETVGCFDFSKRPATFTGDADASAHVFVEHVISQFKLLDSYPE